MPIIEEFDHLMDLDPHREGFAAYDDALAMNERIHEWFETPVGTLADAPSWGHNLTRFKHEPMGIDLEIAVTMAVHYKLSMDIENFQFLEIGVAFTAIDVMMIYIRHKLGEYEQVHQL
jgi:hypothetical protein